MKRLGLLAVAFTACALAVTPAASAKDFSTQVVGGSTDRQPDVQWIAALTYRGDFECGGSLVAPRYVLTAAHCIYTTSGPSGWRARLGSKDRAQGGSLVRVTGGGWYPRFRPKTGYGDMALLKLGRRVGYEPVRLAPRGTFPAGQQGYVAGWGSTHWSSNAAPRLLRSARVPFRTDRPCKRAARRGVYGRLAYDGSVMICAGDGHPDTCTGDSGGPLARRIAGRWQLVGVTSFGHPRCNGPGVYAWVGSPELRRWLRNRLGI